MKFPGALTHAIVMAIRWIQHVHYSLIQYLYPNAENRTCRNFTVQFNVWRGIRRRPVRATMFTKNHVTISAGYGAPSILRAFLKYNNTRSEYTVKGWGPYMFKIDWMFHRRWSVGINGSYNFSRLSWMDDGWDTVIHAKRLYEYGIEAEELAATLRVNYHFLIRKTIDLYAGLGAGYGKFALGTYTEAPVNQFSVAYEFPKPLSLEATLGGRYYITKWLGLYAEVGLGKSWILFRKSFCRNRLSRPE
ncbi:MAG: hypothetical protein HWD58_04450 [Bacteroidota bacterium]|nr:MAG: hypothetical protein HWD58_04450 [Bacteroidota bacterium]